MVTKICFISLLQINLLLQIELLCVIMMYLLIGLWTISLFSLDQILSCLPPLLDDYFSCMFYSLLVASVIIVVLYKNIFLYCSWWTNLCCCISRLPFLFLQFDEQKEQVAVEQILRVVFLDPERSSPVSTIVINFKFQCDCFCICSVFNINMQKIHM